MLMEGWLCGLTAMFSTHVIYTVARKIKEKKEEEEESNSHEYMRHISSLYIKTDSFYITNVLVIRIPVLSVAHAKQTQNPKRKQKN